MERKLKRVNKLYYWIERVLQWIKEIWQYQEITVDGANPNMKSWRDDMLWEMTYRTNPNITGDCSGLR